jgi:hypothetical protein
MCARSKVMPATGEPQQRDLQRRCLRSRVEAVGDDSKAFLKAVHERELGALAGVPLTLELLIKVFRKEQTFPQRTSEIYEKALFSTMW